MEKIATALFWISLTLFSALPGQAAVITLREWTYNINGVVSDSFDGGSMPVTGNLYDGFGTLSWTTDIAGSHTFNAFYDYDIDDELNGFSNETAMSYGTLSQGQSWEIDEPGYSFGNIYDNAVTGSLDNTNSLSGMNEDVSLALGWSFTLGEEQAALISLLISEYAPASGFYLQQFDPDSNSSIYLSSTLDIAVPVPEPCSLLLLGAGMVALASLPVRRDNHTWVGQ